GVAPDDVVVCSFGYVGAGKLSRDLVEAWLTSSLAYNSRCRLVFVGGHQMEGDYQQSLSARVAEAGARANIEITGYVDAATYTAWLAAADVAVQLRAQSRGETSRAVLDSMAAGLPVIVNAHGANRELPSSAVYLLNDACSITVIAQ